jgi:hypothetical protein
VKTLAVTETPAARPPDVDAPRRRRVSDAALLVGLYAVAAAVYLLLVHRASVPSLYPDEIRYSQLARGLADGDGFNVRGEHVGQSAALYVYFITPVWALFNSATDAYSASRVLGTLALCAQALPVWLLGRELLADRRLALLPAALSVAGTWMVSSAQAATEVLAYPLATGALCVAVLALRRPGTRLGWLAFGLALLATWARIQLVVLLPALVAAFAVDSFRVGEQRAARLRAHRPYLLTAGALTLALTIVVLAAPSVTGDYAGYFHFRPSLARVVGKSGLQFLQLVALTGFLPVLVAGGAALTRAAWRDDRAGPLLAVFWMATPAIVLQSGFFLAGYTDATWGIQRYVAYVAPLSFVLLAVLLTDRGLLTRRAFVVAAGMALGLLAHPVIRSVSEERASWATSYRLHQVLPMGPAVALTTVAMVVLAATLLARSRARAATTTATTAFGIVLLILVVQAQASWHQFGHYTASLRAQHPRDLQWIDHHSDGDVALLALTQHAPMFLAADVFNRSVRRILQPEGGVVGRPPAGRACTWVAGADGTLSVDDGCGPVPHRFLINDPWSAVTFHDERESVSDVHGGRITTIAPAVRPRLESLLLLPCPPHPTPRYTESSPHIPSADGPVDCGPALRGKFWLDSEAEFVVRIAGGSAAHSLSAGSAIWNLPPRRTSLVRFPAPRGSSEFALLADWSSTVGAPRIVAAQLTYAHKTVRLRLP